MWMQRRNWRTDTNLQNWYVAENKLFSFQVHRIVHKTLSLHVKKTFQTRKKNLAAHRKHLCYCGARFCKTNQENFCTVKKSFTTRRKSFHRRKTFFYFRDVQAISCLSLTKRDQGCPIYSTKPHLHCQPISIDFASFYE